MTVVIESDYVITCLC